jgi:integrase
MREHVERNLASATIRETRRVLERDVKPRWRDRPVREITRQDVNDLLDAKAGDRDRPRRGRKDGAGVLSNRILALLSAMFSWAASQDLVDGNPTAGVRRRVKEVARDRVLAEDELLRFWTGCKEVGWPFGPMFQLLLLTAQRRDEVGAMRWGEIDLAKKIWTIPASRSKNNEAHYVHLAPLAIEIIQELPQIVGEADLVFTTTGRTPVSGFGRAKERLDALIGEMSAWTVHDLRRTVATKMAEDLKIPPHVADKILNHANGGIIKGTAKIYNRAKYLPERKAALQAWGRFIESLVRPPTETKVVALAAAR